MKEFIEKLIGRLEEEKQRLRKLKNDCIALSDHEVIAIEEGAYNFCKEIVNQLAEEYDNDFCEWKFETTGIVWHCNGCETYNLPYAMNLMIIADDFECKCPHCGKKIKVVEPKGE